MRDARVLVGAIVVMALVGGSTRPPAAQTFGIGSGDPGHLPLGTLTSVQICIRVQTYYTDGGFGEDYWTSNTDRTVPGIWVRIRDTHGVNVYEGFTDDGTRRAPAGCTPSFVTLDTSKWTILVQSKALVKGNTIRTYRDASLKSPASWVIVRDLDAGQNWFTTPSETPESSALAAAARALYYHPGGMTNKTYDIHIASTDGNHTDPSDGEVHLTASGSRRKFTVVHEVGHSLMKKRLGSEYYNDVSYNAPAGDPCEWHGDGDHSMSSIEFSEGAFDEGFAHFYAAITWNSTASSNGVFVYYKKVFGWPTDQGVIELEGGTPYMETTCGPGQNGHGNHWGYGNEMDWMRFFWDFATDDDVPFDDIVEIIAGAAPIQKVAAYGSLVFSAATYKSAIYVNSLMQQAMNNGIDY